MPFLFLSKWQKVQVPRGTYSRFSVLHSEQMLACSHWAKLWHFLVEFKTIHPLCTPCIPIGQDKTHHREGPQGMYEEWIKTSKQISCLLFLAPMTPSLSVTPYFSITSLCHLFDISLFSLLPSTIWHWYPLNTINPLHTKFVCFLLNGYICSIYPQKC